MVSVGFALFRTMSFPSFHLKMEAAEFFEISKELIVLHGVKPHKSVM
jgi:hypothetical protein